MEYNDENDGGSVSSLGEFNKECHSILGYQENCIYSISGGLFEIISFGEDDFKVRELEYRSLRDLLVNWVDFTRFQ